MVEKTKMNSLDDVGQILQFFDNGMSIKDISNKSKEKLGYNLKEATIREILRRNNRLTIENIKKMHNIVTKKEMIPFSNTTPPHNVHYGFPLMKCKHPNCQESCNYNFCSKECEDHFKILKKRRNDRAPALEYLGGKCKRCGFNEDTDIIQFHHLDPCDKKYNISDYLYKGFEFVRAELNKCVLLCLNCHKIVHKIKDPNYFIINNYFFSHSFENLKKNSNIHNNDECTNLDLEK